VIRAIGLSKRYSSGYAVQDVSFDVPRGELLSLVGGSGSGKTTTLKMLNRLIEPSSGHVEIDGEDTRRKPQEALRRHIGYAFQRLGLFPRMTVAQNIGITPKLLGWPAEQIQQRVDELLELVELGPQVRDRYPHSMSGGQQQRVGLARALAARPSIMLLDEPFGALDPLTRDRIQKAFHRIQKELSLTAVFVTHDLAEACILSDRIAVMHHGRLLQLATPSELLNHPADSYVEELVEAPRQNAQFLDALFGGPRA